MERRTGRIVEILEELIQLRLIAQGQNQDKAHGLCRGEIRDELRLPAEGYFAHLSRQRRHLRLAFAHEEEESQTQERMQSAQNEHSVAFHWRVHTLPLLTLNLLELPKIGGS